RVLLLGREVQVLRSPPLRRQGRQRFETAGDDGDLRRPAVHGGEEARVEIVLHVLSLQVEGDLLLGNSGPCADLLLRQAPPQGQDRDDQRTQRTDHRYPPAS